MQVVDKLLEKTCYIYNPDEEMCELLEQIVASEGMFWRKAE